MKKYIVILTEEEHEDLGELTSKGEHKSQKIVDALILRECKVIFLNKVVLFGRDKWSSKYSSVNVSGFTVVARISAYFTEGTYFTS